jgi:hypothetical protein
MLKCRALGSKKDGKDLNWKAASIQNDGINADSRIDDINGGVYAFLFPRKEFPRDIIITLHGPRKD